MTRIATDVLTAFVHVLAYALLTLAGLL